MKATQRQKKLIEILTYHVDYVTVQNLAEELSVSKRTIHNDLSQLEKEGFSFDKKPSVGLRLLNMSSRPCDDTDIYDPEHRRLDILKELLFYEKKITYQSASENYLVSVSSIIADINFIKDKILNETTVKLIGDENGTRLTGNEEQWQKTLVSFNEYLISSQTIQFDDAQMRNILKEYYDEDIIECSYEIINSLKEYNMYYVAQHYILNLLNVMIVMCYRLRKGYHHKISHDAFYSDQIMSLMNYLVGHDLLELLTDKLQLHYEEGDIYFLSMYLSANRITFLATENRLRNENKQLVKSIIERMSRCLDVDLTKDLELFNNLYLHLFPMIYRLKNQIYITNPMLQEIKKQYHLMFDLTWMIMDSMKNKLEITFTEDEIGFLMLHFQNALEKQKQSKRILVVCPNGITTSGLIANRIRSVLPPLDIIEAASIEDVKSLELKSIDFIVSTVPLKNIQIPVVVVSMLLNDVDVKRVEELYRKKIILPQENNVLNFKMIDKYLQKKHIYVHHGKISKEEVIHYVCSSLYDDGFVDDIFEKSIIERESKGGTDIAVGGAIPHGTVSTVKKTQLAIWINDESIKWSKYRVKVIVFFALSGADMNISKGILEEAFSLIKTKEMIEKLSSMKDVEEVTTYIFGGKQID